MEPVSCILPPSPALLDFRDLSPHEPVNAGIVRLALQVSEKGPDLVISAELRRHVLKSFQKTLECSLLSIENSYEQTMLCSNSQEFPEAVLDLPNVPPCPPDRFLP